MNDRRKTEPRQYKHNPLASCWPMLDEDQMTALVEDIKAHGLRNAIVLDQDDQILDGRNRNAACILAGVTPTFEVFIGGPEQQHAFVMSQNAQRRHMTSSQRAGVAGKMAAKLDEMKVANQQQAQADKAAAKAAGVKTEPETKSAPDAKPEPQGRTRAAVAKAMGISERSVQDGKKVAKQGTEELQNAVDTGALAVHRAAKIADLPAEKQPEALKEAIEKPRETKSAKPAKTVPEITDDADPSIALLSALLNHVSPSRIVSMLARLATKEDAKSFAKFLREAARVVELLDPDNSEVIPAEDRAGKTPTAARLEMLIPGSFSADLRQAAIDWARHKQRMVKKSRIQSEDAWSKALKRMTKYPGPVVVEMIETAMSNNWVGWEHEPKQINVAKAGVKVRKDREVHYDSIPT